jgi:hypothetical protein
MSPVTSVIGRLLSNLSKNGDRRCCAPARQRKRAALEGPPVAGGHDPLAGIDD